MTRQLWQRLKPLVQNTLHRGKQPLAVFAADLIPAATPATFSYHHSFTGSAEQFPFQPGYTILDRFRIIRPLGRGGMGEVYEAEDLQLGRIALKTIHHGIGLSASVSQQFRQEIQLARRVSGPQICRIHDLFELPPTAGRAATPFLTMEYLEGVTLSQKLRKDGPLPWKQALPVALEICAGLRLIHDNGIIHRDLKCANIMLCKQQDSTRVVLMDFGLASRFHSGGVFATATTLASTGASQGGIAGTPQYMAPEQFEGKPLTPAADIYALGVILYELVTGKHPFAADTPLGTAIRRAQRLDPPSSLGFHVPRHWDRIIARCLEFDPAHRFASANDVASALSVGPGSIRHIRQDRPWALRFVAAALAAAALWGASAWWQTRQYYRTSAQAQHWYDTGVAAIHEGTYVKATHSLKEAVDQDPKFAMAHVRLAEAWENLDFETDAQQEMLLAAPGEHTLAPLDHLYLEAIRMTISHDFTGAIDRYQTILNKLPSQQKSDAYVDLGKAYERAGDPTRALNSYAEGSRLDTQSAAPWLRIAILQSRRNRGLEADAAFLHAETLLNAESNQEGLAELDFQRGYSYNDRGDTDRGKIFLQRALVEAATLNSIQLEIRAHTQLSSSLYASGHPEEAATQAEDAVRLARDNRLDFWSADGLNRLASARIVEGKLPQAEDAAREALQIAIKSGQLRSQALANLNLASIMDQEGRTDQVIAPARAALNFYEPRGFFKPAAALSILLIRTQNNQGDHRKALEAGTSFLNIAYHSGDKHLQLLAEESVGNVYDALEDYPNALDHYQKAKSLADKAKDIVQQTENCADMLAHLGRYSEFESQMNSIFVSKDNAATLTKSRLYSLLSRMHYREAFLLAEKSVHSELIADANTKAEIGLLEAVAVAHLGRGTQAITMLERPLDANQNSPAHWTQELLIAEAETFAGRPRQGRDTASRTAEYFTSKNERVSALWALYLAACASKLFGDTAAFGTYQKKALDTMSHLQQDWDSQSFQIFFTRPDIEMVSRDLQLPGPSQSQ